jgi:hypothetical protein
MAGVRRRFQGVHGGDAAADDAQLAAAGEDAVEAVGFVPGGDFRHLGAQPVMGRLGVGGDHHPGRHVAAKARRGRRRDVPARRDQGLGMADPGGQAQDHRNLPAFRDFEGGQGVVVGFLGVAGFQHGRHGGAGVVAVVLLVLAGGHARVVGGDDDQAAIDIGVGGGEQGVGGDVEAHVLHGHQGAAAGEGHAEAHFQGHLLVGRPLGAAAQMSRDTPGFPWRGCRDSRCPGPRRHAGRRGRRLRRR